MMCISGAHRLRSGSRVVVQSVQTIAGRQATWLDWCLQGELESSVYHRSNIISTLSSQYMTLDAGDAMWVGSAETRTAFLPRTKVSAGGLLARLVEGGGLPTKVLPCLPACTELVRAGDGASWHGPIFDRVSVAHTRSGVLSLCYVPGAVESALPYPCAT